ncbi:acyltransferase [Psychrobacillus psychrodurans]|uniref:acyltransferase family protein n=1 Tax=Psychrobacillus psychrodurans TaxID=126157 RepID=UPI001F4EF0D5|nr:acyltransferase [Psychrobacillus psychrodurans]MCK1997964.1 acyltransferase [Psychrobacillus psychrodurans]
MQNTSNDKVWFAHMLRGVACLIVVFFHYCLIFWSEHEGITNLYSLIPIVISSDMNLLSLSSFLNSINVNLGSVGVGLFFIISGFVIPFSFNSTSSLMFLIKRFFRIIPPYAIGLFLTLFAVYLYAKYNNFEFTYTFLDYIVNLSLLRDWFDVFGFRSIDGINWTLQIEMKFYFICALIALISSLKSNKTLIITSSIMLAITVFLNLTSGSFNIYFDYFLRVTSAPFFHLTYMMIGICFYNFFKKNWTSSTFIATTSFIVVATIVILYLLQPGSFKQSFVSYGFALIMFGVFYYFKEKLSFNPILNFFANISYPLYIVHGLIGYILITVFYSILPNAYIVIMIVFSIVVTLSYLLHRFIELPSVQLGKLVAEKYKQVKTTKINIKQNKINSTS